MSLPTIFSLIHSAACLHMCRNYPTNQRLGNTRNSVEHDQKLIRLGSFIMSWPTHYGPNLISGLSANPQKLLNLSEARKRRRFGGTWPKVIRPGDAHNELAHENWAQSDQRSVFKCVENARPTRGQETVEIQWSVTKKLNSHAEAHNELAHKIWARSDQHFVGKYTETASPIGCQETAEIHWTITKVGGGQQVYCLLKCILY